MGGALSDLDSGTKLADISVLEHDASYASVLAYLAQLVRSLSCSILLCFSCSRAGHPRG